MFVCFYIKHLYSFSFIVIFTSNIHKLTPSPRGQFTMHYMNSVGAFPDGFFCICNSCVVNQCLISNPQREREVIYLVHVLAGEM